MDDCAYQSFGKHSRIIKPMRIYGKRRIVIGDHVTILNQARIETIRCWGDRELNGRLTIGDNTSIEQCCHIIAAGDVSIARDCVLSAFVYISDCSHGYGPEQKIMNTDLDVKPVSIGDHCFIGIGSCILPGSHIGNNAVIGANSVVTGDIPENCMAAGSPARIIKRFNKETHEWKKA